MTVEILASIFGITLWLIYGVFCSIQVKEQIDGDGFVHFMLVLLSPVVLATRICKGIFTPAFND